MTNHSLNSLELAPPDELGLCPVRWRRLLDAADELRLRAGVPALSFQIQRRGLTTGVHCFGSCRLSSQQPVDVDTLFLTASLTKPMLAMGTMLLVERGKLALNERVSDLLPEFRDAPKRPTTIRHLLTHTSGLPDMLPNNQELRMSQAPLSTFVSETCRTELLFPPGRGAQYQSMGYALLGPIIQTAAGATCRTFLRRELFEPLGMTRSWLGLPMEALDDPNIAEVDVPEAQLGGDDWNWNSRYWRQLGAPWGGVLATVEDVSRFCLAMITGGRTPDGHSLFSPATIQEAAGNRLYDLAAISESECRTRGWGLGWRMNWKDHRSTFSDLLAPDVIGHWGATGTLCWIDRRREMAAVILSTRPLGDEASSVLRLSNMIAAAFTDAHV